MIEPPSTAAPGVLIVDDEPHAAHALQRFLQASIRNLRVLVETDPQTALARLHDEDIHLVIVDQVMDGITGTEFLAHARKSAPHVRRLLVTAHVESVLDSRELAEAGAAHVLLKPLATEPFLDIVRRLLVPHADVGSPPRTFSSRFPQRQGLGE